MVVARDRRGVWNSELMFQGYRVGVLHNGEFWGWMVVMVVQQCECA